MDCRTRVLFPSERDLLMHMAAIMQVAMADGVYHQQEAMCIQGMANNYSSLFGFRPFDALVNDLPEIERTAVGAWLQGLKGDGIRAKNLIKDMIVLAYADGEFCQEERKEITDVAAILEIPMSEVETLNRLYVAVIESATALQQFLQESV